MFAVIYRFKLKPHQEENYIKQWNIVADFFIQECGAIGSCLHQGEDNLWVAYSRWPDKATRDAAWPQDSLPNQKFPEAVTRAINEMQKLKDINKELEEYTEICLEVVSDKIL